MIAESLTFVTVAGRLTKKTKYLFRAKVEIGLGALKRGEDGIKYRCLCHWTKENVLIFSFELASCRFNSRSSGFRQSKSVQLCFTVEHWERRFSSALRWNDYCTVVIVNLLGRRVHIQRV